MTSGPNTITAPETPATDHDRHQLRLKLKPKGPTSGYVDGGWWPRSRDLAAELPALVEVLAVRLGHVSRVAYSMSGWNESPRRIEVDGHVVRLEGFRSQDEHIVYVSGPDRTRVGLLVVPPETADDDAHQALMSAAHRENSDLPADLLAGGDAVHQVSSH